MVYTRLVGNNANQHRDHTAAVRRLGACCGERQTAGGLLACCRGALPACPRGHSRDSRAWMPCSRSAVSCVMTAWLLVGRRDQEKGFPLTERCPTSALTACKVVYLAYHTCTADAAETASEAATMASSPRDQSGWDELLLGITSRDRRKEEGGHAGRLSRFHIAIAARTMHSAMLESGRLHFLHIINAATSYDRFPDCH